MGNFTFLCVDVNECETDGVCSPYATCDNYPGSFNCTCNSGYRGDGFNCYGEFSLYAQGDSDVISFRIYRVGQKTGLFFRLDNFVMVSPRKACGMSKFSKFYREKGKKTRISITLNILCQICSNHHNS